MMSLMARLCALCALSAVIQMALGESDAKGSLRMIGGQTKLRRMNEEIVHRPGERGVGRTRSASGEKVSGFGEIAIGMLV